jgi:hypothetical protein
MKSRRALRKKQKDLMILSAMSSPRLCSVLIDSEISEEHFDDSEEHYRILFNVISSFYKQFTRVPLQAELLSELDDGEEVDDAVFDDIVELIEKLYADDFVAIEEDLFKHYLFEFIEDSAWKQLKNTTGTANSPENMDDAVETWKNLVRPARRLKRKATPPSFPPDFLKKPIKDTINSFGSTFFDSLCGGGASAKELLCILGPTGGGKTTLSQQISIDCALRQLSLWKRSHKKAPLGLVYFVSYEMPRTTVLFRAVAHGASIKIQRMFQGDMFSHSGALNNHDRELFKKEIEMGFKVLSEKERIDILMKKLLQSWKVLDFSGMENEIESDADIGTGGIAEVRDQIKQDLDEYKAAGVNVRVAAIFLDYLDLIARRYIMARPEMKMSADLRPLCFVIPDLCRRLLGAQFNCPVIITQQLNSEGNKLKPGIVGNISMAAECQTIAQNCDFVMALSNLTVDHYGRIGILKGRRTAHRLPQIYRLRGEFSRLEEINNWEFDEVRKEFIPIRAFVKKEEDEEEQNEDSYNF